MSNLEGTTNAASKSHLAVITGGAMATNNVTDLSAAVRATQTKGAASRGTTFDTAGVEGARNRDVSSVREAARGAKDAGKTFDDDVLYTMVRAAGLPESRAKIVWEVIKDNAGLRAHAERAFNRAQLDVVTG